MHDVKIDEEGIGAEFDAAAAGVAPGAPGAAGQAPEVLPPAGEAWRPVTGLVAGVINAKLCPAWDVPQETRDQWADALGECLEQLMPGGLGNVEAWGPWGKLAFASSMWVLAGFDPETMTIKPRYPQATDDGDRGGQHNEHGGFGIHA